MMRRVLYLFIIATVALYSEEYVVITNRESPISTLTKKELKSIYLKRRRYYKDIKLTPLNLSLENNLRKDFQSDILDMSFTQLESYWMKQHYKGHRPPYQLKSYKGTLLFIKKRVGAIGYVPYSFVDNEVKIIYRSGGL